MTFPRVASLVLALGGSAWAFLLLAYGVFILRYSASGTFFWGLIWLPGFLAWYGYIRRVFGHFLLRRALITWLVSLVANLWSLAFMWLAWNKPSGNLPKGAWVPLLWFFLAIVVSIVCLILERRALEPKIETTSTSQVDEVQFGRLLAEHRERMANKGAPPNGGGPPAVS